MKIFLVQKKKTIDAIIIFHNRSNRKKSNKRLNQNDSSNNGNLKQSHWSTFC